MTNIVRNVLVYGAGQIAELVHYYLSNDSHHAVCGFIVDDEFPHTGEFCGLPIVSPATVLNDYPPRDFAMFVAISYSSMNADRRRKCEWARVNGYELISYVSSRATTYPNLKIGDNCLVLENNTLQPFVTIGNNVFLWSGNHIGHHSVIRDDAFVSSHCVISGNCVVGERSFLGVNCTLQNGVHVGAACFIGPGSLIKDDVVDEAVLLERATPTEKITSRFLRL
jgi:sugar O-acyltransferase (sialic acid O-acetyltransferase NeuD family)